MVKLPKHARLFVEDTSFDSTASLEPANHEFETYTRKSLSYNVNTPTSNKLSIFENLNTDERLKNSTINSNNLFQSNQSKNRTIGFTRKFSNSYLDNHSTSTFGQESFLYFKIIQKLSKASFKNPANIPILCTQSFNIDYPRWSYLAAKLKSSHSHLKLIEINQGVPVNSLFYLSDLDLVYVKTADDLEGCIPRCCCQPITASFEPPKSNIENMISVDDSRSTNSRSGCSSRINCDSNYETFIRNSVTFSNTNTYNPSERVEDNSIKYHSFSIETEYDDLIEENPYSNIVSSQQG